MADPQFRAELYVMSANGGFHPLLVFYCCGSNARNNEAKAVKRILRQKYEELGKVSFAEKSVIIFFCSLVALWIFRDPRFVPGWGSLFQKGYTSDSTCAIFIAVLLFIWPSEFPEFRIFNRVSCYEMKPMEPLLTWRKLQKKFPWDVVMLLGGGFSMAKGVQASGLSDVIAEQLTSLENIPIWAFVCIAIMSVTFMTEFSSNAATSSIFVPLMASVARSMNVNPLYFMIPVTIASSFAFMLPISNPPNTIVFGTGLVTMTEMIKSGVVMTFTAIAISSVSMNTYVYRMFNLGQFPSWAERVPNMTTHLHGYNLMSNVTGVMFRTLEQPLQLYNLTHELVAESL